jgi:hypothetical protein
LVTERVVHIFEVIEVQGENSHLVMLPVSTSERLFKSVLE